MLSNDELLLPIEVRRDFVLLDALREARKKKFDPRKYLKVSYNGGRWGYRFSTCSVIPYSGKYSREKTFAYL